MIELPEVIEDGMSGRNEQRKPGTARGSPRRSRTAKASRISRLAVKSRCAHEGDGWGRISDNGSGHYNPNPSEDPWGGGVISLHGGAQSSLWPDTVRDNRDDSEVHKERRQTGRWTAYAGSRLKLPTIQEGTAWKANLPAGCGKSARPVVCPAKAGMFSRRQTCRGKSQSPVVWIAEVMETETLKPIDKVSPGEATSHRAVTKVNALWPRK